MKKIILLLALVTLMFADVVSQHLPRQVQDLQTVAQFEPPLSNVSCVTRDLNYLVDNRSVWSTAWHMTDSLGRVSHVIGSKIDPWLQIGGSLFQPCRLQPDGSYTAGVIAFDSLNEIVTGGIERFGYIEGEYMSVDLSGGLDIHSYVEDSQGRSFYAEKIQIEGVDYSSVTNNVADTSVTLLSHRYVIKSDTGRYTFAFDDVDMLKKVPLEVVLTGDQSRPWVGVYDITHMNYADVLAENRYFPFSHRHPIAPGPGQQWTGIGVIDVLADSVKWIGYGHDIKLDQKLDIVFQHDFKKIRRGPFRGYFSVYNNGDSTTSIFNQNSSVLILDIDFDADSAHVVKQIDFPEIYSVSMGNIIYEEERIIVNHGAMLAFLHGKQQINVTVHDYDGDMVSQHALPGGVFSYNIEVAAPQVFTNLNLSCEEADSLALLPSFLADTLDGMEYLSYEFIPGRIQSFVYPDCVPVDTLSVVSASVNSFSVYPNPSTGNFHIEGLKDQTSYEVYDLTRKRVDAGEVQNQQINLSHQPEGFYFIKLNIDETNIVTQKVTIVR
jgi:hypothetical protein